MKRPLGEKKNPKTKKINRGFSTSFNTGINITLKSCHYGEGKCINSSWYDLRRKKKIICRKMKPYITAQGPFPNPSKATRAATVWPGQAVRCSPGLHSRLPQGIFQDFPSFLLWRGVDHRNDPDSAQDVGDRARERWLRRQSLPAGSSQGTGSFPVPAPGERKGPESTQGTFWLIMSN